MHTTEPLVPEPCSSESEIGMKSWKDVTHQILIKLLQNRSK